MNDNLSEQMLGAHCFLRNVYRGFDANHFTLSLNPTQRRTLMIIHRSGTTTMSAVCKELGMEKGSFTSVIHALVDQGLVQRSVCQKDRRKMELILTPKGVQNAELAHEQLDAYLQELVRQLGGNAAQSAVVEAVRTLASYLPHLEGALQNMLPEGADTPK